MCEDDNEPKSYLINLRSCQMNEYNDKSNEEHLLMSEFDQECSLLQPSSFPLLYKESSRNGSLNFDNIPHSFINLDKMVLSYSHDVELLPIPKFESVINLETFPSQIPRSIIIKENTYFQSTLPSQLLKSSCMDSCSNQF